MGRPRKPTIQEVARKDGSIAYRVRTRANGVHGSETFDTKAQARVFCENITEFGDTEALAMLNRQDHNHPDYVPTLAEMLERHIGELTGVEQRTKDDYRAVAARTWLPMLGRYPVDSLTRAHVARWVNSEEGRIKPKSIKNAHSVLSAVLKTAVHYGHLLSNPAQGTRLPRTGEETTEEIRFLTYGEFDRLLDHTPEHYKPFVALLFGTGLRFSEATALQVQDINPEFGTLRVMRAWKREHGKGLKIGPPKSKAARRTIDCRAVLPALLPLLDRPGNEWLFVTATGRPVLHSNFYNRIWAPACKAAGLEPRPRIHDARHSHASWMIGQGARLEVVQERLGHEDYLTTRRVYAHLIPDMQAEAALAASRVFQFTALGQRADLPNPPALPSP